MTTSVKPSGSRRGVVQRFTGKVGPLPAWAWALLILAAGYLVYRLTQGRSSSTATATDAAPADTPTTSGEAGSPPASGQGGAADNLNADALSQLSGLAGSVDALTGLIQSTPAFEPGYSGSAGSGSSTPNDGTMTVGDTGPAGPAGPAGPRGPAGHAPAKQTATATAKRPAARPPAPAKVRHYTYKPGQAPRGHKKEEAPSKGPAGTSLHYKRGAGYFYA